MDEQFSSMKKILLANQKTIIQIFQLYKNQPLSENNQVCIGTQDFVQLFSRQKFHLTKLQEFIAVFEGKLTKNDQQLLQFCDMIKRNQEESVASFSDEISCEVQEAQIIFQQQLQDLPEMKTLSTQLETEVLKEISSINKLLGNSQNSESMKIPATDLSRACNEAYKKLIDNPLEIISPVKNRLNGQEPHPTPASQSIDFSKFYQQPPFKIQDQSISMIKYEGEWDSKLESDVDKSMMEFEKIKQAVSILESAKILNKVSRNDLKIKQENLSLLIKCSEINQSVDRQIYLDGFLQMMKFKLKKQNASGILKTNSSANSNLSKQKIQIPKPEDQILRDQVLQVPMSQDFSFESPLPSLRNQEEQPQIQQKLHHVQLEDLLKVKSIEEVIMQEEEEQEQFQKSNESPLFKKPFLKKQNVKAKNDPKKRVIRSTSATNGNSLASSEGSFYSQQNIKNYVVCPQQQSQRSSKSNANSMLKKLIIMQKQICSQHSQDDVSGNISNRSFHQKQAKQFKAKDFFPRSQSSPQVHEKIVHDNSILISYRQPNSQENMMVLPTQREQLLLQNQNKRIPKRKQSGTTATQEKSQNQIKGKSNHIPLRCSKKKKQLIQSH